MSLANCLPVDRSSFSQENIVMGKNLYERRKERANKRVPPATYKELERLVIKRAADFCKTYWITDGWSKTCECKALMLNMAVEHLLASKPDKRAEQASVQPRGSL
jgi:hypothetical protein